MCSDNIIHNYTCTWLLDQRREGEEHGTLASQLLASLPLETAQENTCIHTYVRTVLHSKHTFSISANAQFKASMLYIYMNEESIYVHVYTIYTYENGK